MALTGLRRVEATVTGPRVAATDIDTSNIVASEDGPPGQRVAFGWPAAPVRSAGMGQALRVGFLPGPAGGNALRSTDGGDAILRFTVAGDDREARTVLVRSVRDGAPLGAADVRYADPHQRFGVTLTGEHARGALVDGLELTLAGPGALWVFAGEPAPPGHRISLLHAGQDPVPPPAGLATVDSVQPFGWMEGAVLDALMEGVGTRPLAAEHLSWYLRGGELVYEDPRGRPADNRFYGIEATLPIATIAQLLPDHAVVALAIASWRALTDEDGCVREGSTTAEGCYTVAYPMAVIARHRRDPDLAACARRQILLRRERLFDGDRLCLRRLADGGLVYRGWARAYAWYLLGTVRTARCLDGFARTDDLWAEARRVAGMVLAARRPDGLWSCYLDDPETGGETCASAGIAAAFALGHESGGLGRAYGRAAVDAWRVLLGWLTPDGWLAGSSQSNKGGELLQRTGYRVISGVATGLMGQLGAALARLGPRQSTAGVT